MFYLSFVVILVVSVVFIFVYNMIKEPKYTPGSNDEHGTIEARDNYEKWYYEKYWW